MATVADTDRVTVYRNGVSISVPAKVFRDYLNGTVYPFAPNALGIASFPYQSALTDNDVVLLTTRDKPYKLSRIKEFYLAQAQTLQPIPPAISAFPAYPVISGTENIRIRQGGDRFINVDLNDLLLAAAVVKPSNTVLPVISGVAKQGQLLSCSTGTWSNNPVSFSYSYRYVSNNTVVQSGATATYTPVLADVGQEFYCVVTATNAAGDTAVASAKVGPVAAAGTSAVTAVLASGWQFTYPGGESATFTPDTSPETVNVSRAAFSATGAATTVVDPVIVTSRVRAPYPNDANFEINQAAGSSYIYIGDTIDGAVNNSTWRSPKPIANWALPDSDLIKNALRLEVSAWHRNGIACVVFTVTDGGGTTRTFTMSSMSVSGNAYDMNPVLVYGTTIDTSAWPDGVITVNAKVFPKFGQDNVTYALSSVNDTSLNTVVIGAFAPQTYLKNAARFDARPVAYVQAGGNDTTGVWSLTDATARATPFATIKGAIDNISTAVRGVPAQTGIAFGDAAGAILCLGAGTWAAVTTAATKNNAGARFTITRDSTQTPAACIFNTTATAYLARIGGKLRLFDLTWQRTGVGQLNSNVLVEKVLFDNGGNSAAVNSAGTSFFLGGSITGGASSLFNANATNVNLFRGYLGTSTNVEGWMILGSNIGAYKNNSLNIQYLSTRVDGSILQGNKFISPDSGNGLAALNGGVNGHACIQNVIECTHATSSTRNYAISADSSGSSNTHVLFWHNTWTGAYSAGRSNLFYDWATSAARSSDLMSCKGELWVQLNTKADVFSADGSRLGNRAFTHGVDCAGNFSMFRTNSGNSERQFFPGLSCNIATSNTVRNDPLFTDYRATTNVGTTVSAPVAASSGDYSLQAGSPCKNLTPKSPLPFDFIGAARNAALTSTGAYV